VNLAQNLKSKLHITSPVTGHLLLPIFLLTCCSIASAQTSATPTLRPDQIRADKGTPNDDTTPLTTIEEEMRAKRQIKFAEKEHRENMARANEIADLGKGLADAFKQKKQLDREDLKRLERLEKLTRKVRSEAGGEDCDTALEKPPADLESGVSRMGEVAVSLGDKVKDTPRQVISASVIDEANVLLQLIRVVRTMVH